MNYFKKIGLTSNNFLSGTTTLLKIKKEKSKFFGLKTDGDFGEQKFLLNWVSDVLLKHVYPRFHKNTKNDDNNKKERENYMS